MMKVLIFSTAYFPFVGGAEVAVEELVDRLGNEIEFDLITARMGKDLPKTERVGKVNVYRIGIGIQLIDKLLVPFLGAVKALSLQKKNSYAAYWCIMVSYASGAAFIANWFQKRVPIVLTLQEGDSEKYLKWKWLGLIDLSWRLALNRTHHLTAISTYLLERARKLGFRGKATLVPNGVDLKRFSSPSPHVFDPSHTTLITTSRLVRKNGVGDVIEAIKLLPESITFKILGEGPLDSGLKAQTKRLGLEHRVQFIGTISQTELPKYLHEADIFIRPSLSEGQGISFIEAMAAGLPVIATPVGGIVDFLHDGETGVFCQSKNPQSIVKAVHRLATDDTLRKKITENAQKLVKEKYNWDLIAEEMKSKVFQSL